MTTRSGRWSRPLWRSDIEAAVERAKRLHAGGLAAVVRGRAATAEPLLRRALASLGVVDDDVDANPAGLAGDFADVVCRIEITRAWVAFQLRGLEPALIHLERAESLALVHTLASATTALRDQRGVIYLYAGRLPDAVREFDEAWRTAVDGSVEDRCTVLLNRGVARLERGDLSEARADFVHCAELTRAEGMVVEEVMALHNLGYADFLAGDLPAALRAMDEAAELDSSVMPGTALLGKAQVLVEAGLVDEADACLARAGDLFRRERLSRDLAESELERARCALVRGDAAAVRRYAGRARDRFRRRGNDHWRRSAELVLLLGDLAAGRPGTRLLPPAHRLRTEFEAAGLSSQARTAALVAGEAQLAVGTSAALAAARRELDAVGEPGREELIMVRMHDHLVRARLDTALGEPGAARRRVRVALSQLARYQAGFGSTDLATAAAVHGRALAQLDISLALDVGRADAVFVAAERARAVTSRFAAIRPPDDRVAAGLLTELRQNAESLRGVDGATPTPAELRALQTRRIELQRRVLARSWALPGTGAAARPAGLAAVRARLRELDHTMIMFVQAAESLTAIRVGADVHLARLGSMRRVDELLRRVRSDFDALAHAGLPAPLRRIVLGSVAGSLRALDEALLGIAPPDGPLVFVCTGELGQLPWASLPSLAGRSVMVAPSATRWLRSSRSPAVGPPGPPVVHAVAGPGLGRATQEAIDVAGAWPAGRHVVGADATCAELRNALGSSDVVHVAAHGVHQPQHPLFSSLQLADGPLFAHELGGAAGAPAHVVLSACEAGRATVRAGDEALGLASVLLSLGTTSVIAGVARVDDRVAAEVMLGYHRAVAAGVDTATALARAVATVDADHVPPFVHFGSPWTAGRVDAGRIGAGRAGADAPAGP